MNGVIFEENFPKINTQAELETVVRKYNYYDPYYVASACIPERKLLFEKLWEKYESLANKHFLKELKIHFHQRSWEMFLGSFLLRHKFNVVAKKSGPDFTINDNTNEEFFMEAVACEKGDGVNKVPEISYGAVQNVPEEEMLLRLVGSLRYKFEKYKKFIKNRKKPYIVCVNKGELGFPDPQIPLVAKCLFGIGFEQYKRDSFGKLVYAGWSKRDKIRNKNGADVPMNLFENKENDFVSAVIYMKDNVLNGAESDLILFHNLHAKNPLNTKTFEMLEQHIARICENGSLQISFNRPQLFKN